MSEGLYDSYRPAGTRDDGGFVRDRNFVPYGSPRLPHYPELPMSEPDDLIAVVVTEESSMTRWTALFCPRRHELIGPLRPFLGEAVQRNFDLLRQNGKLHLTTDEADHTLCGQHAAGEVLPFQYFRGFSIVHPDPPPPDRDLFEEWNGGEVCRHCLLKALITRDEWE